MQLKNKILIVALNENWTGISRLPFGLNKAGFKTYALCPKKSYLAKTKYLQDSLLYPTFTYARSKIIYLWIIISFFYFHPDIIIPGDEDAILALHNLANFLSPFPYLNFISKKIRESMTQKKDDTLILSKSLFQKRCQPLGIRTPKNIVVDDLENAIAAAAILGFPLVIKFDGGYGGSGVHLCHDQKEMTTLFLNLKKEKNKINLKKIFKSLFFISIFISENKISLQQYIEGMVGQAPFCAYQGKIFAFNSMLKLKTFPGKIGPTAVAQGIEDRDIKNFIYLIAQELNYTGFGALDFIVDEKTGLSYVIEMNPRPTPTCHLGEEALPNDLCKAFFQGLNNLPVLTNPFRPYTIAMFPNEKRRDPESEFIKNFYHDVPQNDPLLFQALNK